MLLHLCEITSKDITQRVGQDSLHNNPGEKKEFFFSFRLKYKGQIFSGPEDLKCFHKWIRFKNLLGFPLFLGCQDAQMNLMFKLRT